MKITTLINKITLSILYLGILFMSQAQAADQAKTAYDFSFTANNGQELPLSKFAGKVILVVNTASKCGFTKQYEGLEKLYQQYKDKGLVVLGVPSNDFGKQEPGTDEEVKEFCKLNFGVTFPLTKKTVVSGDQMHPFYKWASDQMGFGSAPKWNFHKFVIDRNGKVQNYFFSMTKPDSKKLVSLIEKLLDEPAA